MNLPENFILKQLEIGPMGNFFYFIGDEVTNEVAVVDPAWDADLILREAKDRGFNIVAAILTHGHYDHSNALPELLLKHEVPVYVSKHAIELPISMDGCLALSDGDEIRIGRIVIKTLWTPGHTPGCQCLLYKNVLLSGDTLFINGCGRCDLAGGDPKQMYHSLYHVILSLSHDTLIFSGHKYGPAPFDSLGNQKKTNPYLACHNMDEFLSKRM